MTRQRTLFSLIKQKNQKRFSRKTQNQGKELLFIDSLDEVSVLQKPLWDTAAKRWPHVRHSLGSTCKSVPFATVSIRIPKHAGKQIGKPGKRQQPEPKRRKNPMRLGSLNQPVGIAAALHKTSALLAPDAISSQALFLFLTHQIK